MFRSLLAALLLTFTLTSCARAAAFYVVPALRATAPMYDNSATSCDAAEDLWPVADGAPRVMHRRYVQGTYTYEDSTTTTAGTAITFTALYVPAATTVTITAWSSDAGGPGCPVKLDVTPTIIYKHAAKPTIVTIP
jgi:hypothetical protein